MPRQHCSNKIALAAISSLSVILIDQLTKWWVVKSIPLHHVLYSTKHDFLWICHVRNTAIGFSVGEHFSPPLKVALFIVLPSLILITISVALIRFKQVTCYETIIFSLIVGGGFGNLIDRIFRSDGVVDFISVKFYGIFGFERWPTFNVADSAVVVGGVLLAIHLLFPASSQRE
ncbi:MAG: signal peptidase II [Sphaerochaetaceae bacterium]|jgi:signal peptidase II